MKEGRRIKLPDGRILVELPPKKLGEDEIRWSPHGRGLFYIPRSLKEDLMQIGWKIDIVHENIVHDPMPCVVKINEERDELIIKICDPYVKLEEGNARLYNFMVVRLPKEILEKMRRRYVVKTTFKFKKEVIPDAVLLRINLSEGKEEAVRMTDVKEWLR